MRQHLLRREKLFSPDLCWDAKLAPAVYKENVSVALGKETYSHARFFPMLPPFHVLVG